MNDQHFSLADLEQILVKAAGLPAGTEMANEHNTLANVGLDSLAFLQLQTELVDRYSVELPDDWHPEHTFGEIVEFVNAGITLREMA